MKKKGHLNMHKDDNSAIWHRWSSFIDELPSSPDVADVQHLPRSVIVTRKSDGQRVSMSVLDGYDSDDEFVCDIAASFTDHNGEFIDYHCQSVNSESDINTVVREITAWAQR